ncbi:cation/H(+) antiporter 15-like [Abrus precatorius]|uniref:Cation/H(+) antiporter 15-like n=1 Tax=Abrus precatorius TaxID=3816 RepID=A0A8B8M6X5_ABRPR|nr:cation/H(+) antiporter 15-like [Abrus precatorius]XP_027364428.1 cation/H(+) antiporter 15-like [Abrus precatorius]
MSSPEASIPDLACYTTTLDVSNKIWMSDNVLAARVPLLCIQIAYNVLFSRILHHIFKPLHMPLHVAQILAGFFLSASMLGRFSSFFHILYRTEGILAVETFANTGLMYYVFLSGLEMNFETILRSSKKATCTAVAGIVIPMLLGAGFLAIEQQMLPKDMISVKAQGYLFWCLVLSVTTFPTLARLLTGLKIVYTRLGKDALTAAMLIDAYGWILFTLLIPFSNKGGKPLLSAMATLMFIVFCFCVVRPILNRMIQHTTRMETWNYSKLLDLMVGLLVCSYITDMLGTHHVVGAFVYGLILPSGKFADMTMEMLDDFVTEIMIPVYFSGFGLRLNTGMILSDQNLFLSVLFILLLAVPKVLSSMIVSIFFGMPIRDGLGIGLLLNTKGIMAVLLLGAAWDKSLIDPFAFTVMMLAIILMTMLVTPLINSIYKPKFRLMQSQLRTVQKQRFDAELRVVACVHNARQAIGLIHVLEAANATRVSPLHVSVLHLVELTRHGTGLLVARMEGSTAHGGSQGTGPHSEFESITKAFDEFVEGYNAARYDISNVVSTYQTIHEDIYNVTEEKRASIILLPFHKQISSEGVLEVTNSAYSDINNNVLEQPPCSVGIFVNRGLGSLLNTKMSIIAIFIGGPDDREALSIAWRMAGHSGTKLHALRLVVLGEAAEEKDESFQSDSNGLFSTVMDNVVQKELDEEYIFNFRHKGVHNNESISYSEKEVVIETGEEIPLILNEVDKPGYDLYIMGQGSGKNYLVFKKLLEWCDNPELGVMGDIVASTSFGTHSSLLVVQQYMIGRQSKPRHPRKCHAKKNECDML